MKLGKSGWMDKQYKLNKKQIGSWPDWMKKEEQPCFHDDCPECHGTGKKEDGSICIHWISCPCPKCTPRF